MTGLSKLQKREIVLAARRAYAAWPDHEAFEAINSELSRSACFDAWRHVETGKATAGNGSGPAAGIQSLRELPQSLYARVLAHFQQKAGEGEAASHTLARDADNPRRIARYKLGRALAERGLAEEYAATICRRQYRCELDQASAGQLWRLLYTIRNRRQAVAASAGPNDNPF